MAKAENSDGEKLVKAFHGAHHAHGRCVGRALSRADADHNAQFLICQQCGDVSEMDGAAIGKAVARQAQLAGFTVRRQTVELHGECPRCTAS